MSAVVEQENTRSILDTLLSGEELSALTLPSGLSVKLRRMRVRELFLFVTAVSTGLGGNLAFLLSAAETDIDTFSQQVMTLALMAIPAAPDQTLEWVRQMVEPGEDDLTASDRARFYDYLANPTTQDLTGLLKGILEQERGEFEQLGKELAAVVAMLGEAEKPKPKKRAPRKVSS